VFYQPGDQGHEAHIREQVARRREAQLAAMLEDEETPTAVRGDHGHERKLVGPRADPWLQRTLSSVGEHLAAVRDRVVAGADIERHSLVLDLNAGTGLLTWEAVRRAPAGGVWALAADDRAAEALRQPNGPGAVPRSSAMGQATPLSNLQRPVILRGSPTDLPALVAAEWRRQTPGSDEIGAVSAVRFDVVLGRNALTGLPDKAAAGRAIAAVLAPEGRLSLAEIVPRRGQRLYGLADLSFLDAALRERLVAAEEAIYSAADDPMVNWDGDDLAAIFQAAGLVGVRVEVETHVAQQRINADLLARWFFAADEAAPAGGRPSYAQHLRRRLSADEVEQVRVLFERQLRDQVVEWVTVTAFVTGRMGRIPPNPP
jgi:putative ATPase